MVTESVCGRIDLGPLGPTAPRSFCHKRQPQVTDFRVPISQQGGMGNGRHVTFVEANVGVCLPFGSQSIGEDQSRTGKHHSSSTMVVKRVWSLGLLELITPTLEKIANVAQVGCIPS